jgi:hypothetical protein
MQVWASIAGRPKHPGLHPAADTRLSSALYLSNMPHKHLTQSKLLDLSISYCQRPSLIQITDVFVYYLSLAYFQIGFVTTHNMNHAYHGTF